MSLLSVCFLVAGLLLAAGTLYLVYRFAMELRAEPAVQDYFSGDIGAWRKRRIRRWLTGGLVVIGILLLTFFGPSGLFGGFGWGVLMGLVPVALFFLILGGVSFMHRRKNRKDPEDEDASPHTDADGAAPPKKEPPAHTAHNHGHHGSGGGSGFLQACIGLALLIVVAWYAQGHWKKAPDAVPIGAAHAASPAICSPQAPSDAARLSADADYGEATESGMTGEVRMCSSARDDAEFECGLSKDGPWGPCGSSVSWYHVRSRALIPGTEKIAPIVFMVWFEK